MNPKTKLKLKNFLYDMCCKFEGYELYQVEMVNTFLSQQSSRENKDLGITFSKFSLKQVEVDSQVFTTLLYNGFPVIKKNKPTPLEKNLEVVGSGYIESLLEDILRVGNRISQINHVTLEEEEALSSYLKSQKGYVADTNYSYNKVILKRQRKNDDTIRVAYKVGSKKTLLYDAFSQCRAVKKEVEFMLEKIRQDNILRLSLLAYNSKLLVGDTITIEDICV